MRDYLLRKIIQIYESAVKMVELDLLTHRREYPRMGKRVLGFSALKNDWIILAVILLRGQRGRNRTRLSNVKVAEFYGTPVSHQVKGVIYAPFSLPARRAPQISTPAP